MKRPLLAAVGFALIFAPSVHAETVAPIDQVRIVYAEPIDARHLPIRAMMQQRRVLETVQSLLAPFHLPRELTVEARGCNGRETAFYENGTAVFCYEYVELIQRHSPKVATPWGVARNDAIFGAIVDTILHETGHGVFDILDIPVFGREEDAADYFSVYLLTQFPTEDAKRLIQGLAFTMASEGRKELDEKPEPKMFSDSHALSSQRYFNVLCLAYGANPALFGNAVPGGLSPWRADTCASDEFAMLKRAFTKLILPHVDEAKLSAAIAQARFDWSPLATGAETFDKSPLEE